MCGNYVSVFGSIFRFWCGKSCFDRPTYSAVSFSFSFSILSISAPLVSLGSSFLLVSLHPLKERRVKSKRLILISLFVLHFWKLLRKSKSKQPYKEEVHNLISLLQRISLLVLTEELTDLALAEAFWLKDYGSILVLLILMHRVRNYNCIPPPFLTDNPVCIHSELFGWGSHKRSSQKT